MTERKFTSWDDWKEAGVAAGFEGPFLISGTLHLWQFVKNGTEGMWNAASRTGFIHDAGTDS